MTIIFKINDLVRGSTTADSVLPNIEIGKVQNSEDSILKIYQYSSHNSTTSLKLFS